MLSISPRVRFFSDSFYMNGMMNRRTNATVVRTGKGPSKDDAASSEDEEDVFSALSRKSKASKQASSSTQTNISSNKLNENKSVSDAAEPKTESTTEDRFSAGMTQRRYHHQSAARQAAMDSILLELQETATTHSSGHNHALDKPPPDKMGSYCLPGEELVTANLFVGNLAPCTTEEELTELFRQFGDLYSVKIMWPRTDEERMRGRNTGFVCFMNRNDALEAMEYYQERDPLNTGRKMMIRWGKDVKNSDRRGQGANIITSTRSSRMNDPFPARGKKNHPTWEDERRVTMNTSSSTTNIHSMSSLEETVHDQFVDVQECSSSHWNKRRFDRHDDHTLIPTTRTVKYDKTLHYEDAIHVIPPSDPCRLEFITTVAYYVAKDGHVFEKMLIDCENKNPSFAFLFVPFISSPSPQDILEQIYYRWRVYAFAQGDGFHSWRTEPFVMLYHPQIPSGGRFWIPPPVTGDSNRPKDEISQQRHATVSNQYDKRKGDRNKMRKASQPVNSKPASEGANVLDDFEMNEWNDIIHHRLCASKDAIRDAMTFCFDRSTAAIQISQLLQTALLDDRKGVSIDTRIARLFLLSDVLFNSQQPGVKNAYRYRDAIETMAPEIFSSLGKHGQKHGEIVGRMTLNRLRNAVKAVLSAWSDWSVYNTTFLEELDAAFEGIQSNKEKQVEDTNRVEPSVNITDMNPAIDSDIDGEELDDDDLPLDDIDGEALSESELLLLFHDR